MAGNPHLSRAQQNALAKADASVKAADTLKIFAYIFFVVVILIPGLFVSYYFNESDKGGLVISLGWLIGAFLVGSVVRSVGVVLANTSELAAHSIRLIADEQASGATGETFDPPTE